MIQITIVNQNNQWDRKNYNTLYDAFLPLLEECGVIIPKIIQHNDTEDYYYFISNGWFVHIVMDEYGLKTACGKLFPSRVMILGDEEITTEWRGSILGRPAFLYLHKKATVNQPQIFAYRQNRTGDNKQVAGHFYYKGETVYGNKYYTGQFSGIGVNLFLDDNDCISCAIQNKHTAEVELSIDNELYDLTTAEGSKEFNEFVSMINHINSIKDNK